jgi:putative Mn2+ efflux pump MntP
LLIANKVTGITNIMASASAPDNEEYSLLNEKSILNLVAIAVVAVSLSIHPFAISVPSSFLLLLSWILIPLFIITIPIEYNVFLPTCLQKPCY